MPNPLLVILMALARFSIALSCPKITAFRSRSRFLRACLSSLEIFFGGILAIFATISSISLLVITFFCLFLGRILCAAPASSITSMALSGRCLSLIYFAESSAALLIAATEYFTLWCFSNLDLSPLRILIVSRILGSFTSIFWNLLVSA